MGVHEATRGEEWVERSEWGQGCMHESDKW
jgi:hypothetical protein